MKFKNILFIISVLLLAACSHSVHQVHVSGYVPYTNAKTGKIITAKSEQTVIFGFATETNYVEVARNQLMSKCLKGDIKGITSRFSTSHGFFHWKNKILMKAVCLK